jgi:hypothetical protein
MKKDRPGVAVSVLCRPSDAGRIESLLFAETGTFGIRRHLVERSVRARRPHTVLTPWGPVAGKLGWRAGETPIFTPEFEACARLAAEHSLPLRDVYRAAAAAYVASEVPPVPASAAPARGRERDHDTHVHGQPHAHDHDHDHDHAHDHDRAHSHDHAHDHDHGHDHHR